MAERVDSRQLAVDRRNLLKSLALGAGPSRSDERVIHHRLLCGCRGLRKNELQHPRVRGSRLQRGDPGDAPPPGWHRRTQNGDADRGSGPGSLCLGAPQHRGTDHGHGCFVMVISGNALGGVKGTWPGLSNAQLLDGADLAVTTDYRRVLSEILIRSLQNVNLGAVFPGYRDYMRLRISAELPD